MMHTWVRPLKERIHKELVASSRRMRRRPPASRKGGRSLRQRVGDAIEHHILHALVDTHTSIRHARLSLRKLGNLMLPKTKSLGRLLTTFRPLRNI